MGAHHVPSLTLCFLSIFAFPPSRHCDEFECKICRAADEACGFQLEGSYCCGYDDFTTGFGQHCECSVLGTSCTCVRKFEPGSSCIFDAECQSNACSFGFFIGKRCE